MALFRPSSGAQRAHPELRAYQSEPIHLRGDPNHPLTLHYVEPARRPRRGMPRTTIGIILGLGESPATVHPLARRLVREGLARGEWPRVVTYSTPLLGEGAYAPSYKAERAAVALTLAAKRAKGPLDSAGHSQGWASGVTIGPELVEQGVLRTLVGVAPANHLPLRPHHQLHVAQKMMRLVGEALAPRRLRMGLGGHAALGSLVGNMVVHAGSHPWQAFAEGGEILGNDCTERAVALSKLPGIGVAVILAQHDGVVEASETRASLEAAGFAGPIVEIPTDHGGPLMERRWAGPVYDQIVAARPPHLA